MKEDNFKTGLVKVIKKIQPATYTKISQETGLSIWTVSDLMKILEKEGSIWIESLGQAKLVRVKNGE